MMFVFPDAADCVDHALQAAGLNSTLWLGPEDLDGREVVHIQDAGGTEQSVFRTDRLIIDVYATGCCSPADEQPVKASAAARGRNP